MCVGGFLKNITQIRRSYGLKNLDIPLGNLFDYDRLTSDFSDLDGMKYIFNEKASASEKRRKYM